MRKLLTGILSLACVSCVAVALPLAMNNANAKAEESQPLFTETKIQISNSGDRMLIVTGITEVETVYEVGYEINGEYFAQEGDVAETDKYYQSLTLGGFKKTADEFLAGSEGLLVWEVAYDVETAYSIKPYAYVGVINDNGQLIEPDNNTKTYGTEKANFNVLEVVLQYEDGTVIETKTVNYGGTLTEPTAPVKDGYDFLGWFVGDEEFAFEEPMTEGATITAKYEKNKRTVYSIANGNITGIATGLSGGQLGQLGHNFNDGNGGVYALTYDYAGEEVVGENKLGIVFNFGEIKVSHYDSIKIVYQAMGGPDGNHTWLYFDGVKANTTKYGGPQTVDLKELAVANNVTSFSTLQVSFKGTSAATAAKLYVAYIEFVLADNIPVEPEQPAEPEQPSNSKEVVYSAENGELQKITTVIGEGAINTEDRNFANNAEGIAMTAKAVHYSYAGEEAQGPTTGIVIDLGALLVGDYAVMKLTFQTVAANGGTNIYAVSGGTKTELTCPYGGAHIVDLKALAESKGVGRIEKLELSLSTWAKNTAVDIYVASIELVKAGESYTAAGENLLPIMTALNNGTLTTASWNSTKAVVYEYTPETEINAAHQAGVILTLPAKVKISDYKSMTLSYQSQPTPSKGGAIVYLDGVNIGSLYGGIQNVDLIDLAGKKGITEFTTVEISWQGWADQPLTSYKLSVGGLTFVYAD